MGIEITPRPRPPWSRSPPRSGPAPSSSRSCQARGRIIYSRLRAPGSNLELNLARKIFSQVPSIGLGWRGNTGSRVTMWAGFIIMHHRGSSQSPATSQKLFIPGPPLVTGRLYFITNGDSVKPSKYMLCWLLSECYIDEQK